MKDGRILHPSTTYPVRICRESAVVMACYLYNPYLNKIGDGEVKNGEHPITACRFHAHLVSLKKTIQRKV
ncbi:hypothetical protein J6590_084596 [Homalodisca vitripennis]|nr:hypothetical protein J6590_084596 [Homalodisca vitripennis]